MTRLFSAGTAFCTQCLSTSQITIPSFTLTAPTTMYYGNNTTSQVFVAPNSSNGIVNSSIFSLFSPGLQSNQSSGCFGYCLCYLDGSNTCSSIHDPNVQFCVDFRSCLASNKETYSSLKNFTLLPGGVYAFVMECNPQTGTASSFYFTASFTVTYSFMEGIFPGSKQHT